MARSRAGYFNALCSYASLLIQQAEQGSDEDKLDKFERAESVMAAIEDLSRITPLQSSDIAKLSNQG